MTALVTPVPGLPADVAPVIWTPRGYRVRLRVFSFGYLWHHNTLPGWLADRPCTFVLDLRTLLYNPYGDPAMRELTGLDPTVRDYVLTTPGATDLLSAAAALTKVALAQLAERDLVLDIGFGCAGGRHRSVVLANELCDQFNGEGIPTAVAHYDVRRPVYQPPVSPSLSTSPCS